MMRLPKDIQDIWQTLEANHYRSYLVGGCVRDFLLGLQPSDYDIATQALPEQVVQLFGQKARATGLCYGTISVLEEKHCVEITTLRSESTYTDHRRPQKITFGTRIEDDLSRRDFTVNAMAISFDGCLLDPFGGKKDIEQRVLRCVGNAGTRFEEDALRMYRLLRFSSTLGFSIESSTALMVHQKKHLLPYLSAERVFSEMTKLLCGKGVTPVLLDYADALGQWIPDIIPCVGFQQHNPHHCYDVWEHTARAVGSIPPIPTLRWTMLFHDLGKPHCFTQDTEGIGHFYGHTSISRHLASLTMKRLTFPKHLYQAIDRQLAYFDDYFPPERVAVHRAMVKYGKEVTGNLIQTKIADNSAKAPMGLEKAQKPWKEALQIYETLCAENICCTLAQLCIRGEDILRIGFRCQDVGKVLQRLLWEVASETLDNSPTNLYHRAERLFRSGYGK